MNNNKLILIFLVAFLFGCKSDKISETSQIDEATFLKNLESAPSVTVSKNELPDWLCETIDLLIKDYVGKPVYSSLMPAEIYRGEWDKQTVYYITHSHSNCALCFYSENAERIPLEKQEDFDKFYTLSKNWELIFQIDEGVITVGEGSVKSK